MQLKEFIFLMFLGLSSASVNAQLKSECTNLNTPTSNSELPTIATIPPPPPVNSVSFGPLTGGKRIVYYLHGLGGNEGSWAKAGGEMMNLYPDAISMFPDYSNFLTNDIPTAALIIRNNSTYSGLLAADEGNNAVFDIDPERNYMIGSSLGAVVAREIDRQFGTSGDPRRIGGFVGFGGANLGAGIVNGKENLKAMAITACTDLLPGPALDNLPPFWISLLNIGEKVEDITDKFCTPVTGTITSALLGQFEAGIANDIAENAPYLSGLNGHLSNTPKVAFYAVEDEPVFWRTMQFAGVFGPGANDFTVWGANDDQPLWNDVQNAKSKYDEKATLNQALYEWHRGRWLDPFHKAKAKGYKAKADAWRLGAYWWLTANDKFKTAIGLRELVTGSTVSTGCLCTGGGPAIQTMGSCSTPFPAGYNCYQLSMSFPTAVWIDHPNDGIVKASSATYLPNATHSPVLMPGSNHFSNRNDSNTKSCLKGLYDGDYGLYFKIN